MNAPEDFDRFLLWERASRDTLDVKRVYIDMAGDLVAGIVLSQIVYWHLPGRDGRPRLRVLRDGQHWLAKARTEWYSECRVSPKQADRALALLEARGLIEVRVFRFDGSPTKHVRLLPDGFLNAWQACVCGIAPDPPTELPDRSKSILPDGENPTLPPREIQLPQKARSLTMITTETTPAAAAPRETVRAAAEQEDLLEALVQRGVSRQVARQLATAKPEACRLYLEYLPFAEVRSTPGAWLANAIRDEYGPPGRYLQAVRKATRGQAVAAAADQREREATEERERLRSRLETLLREGGDELAAFEAFLARQRGRVEKVLTHLSPRHRAEQRAALDSFDWRLHVYARWLRENEQSVSPPERPAAHG